MTATGAMPDESNLSDHPSVHADEASAPRSTLPDGRQRFLAQVVEHGLRVGRRTPKDFVRHFPPAAIMAGLVEHPQLRANILVPTTGTNEKIALKKSAEGAGEDLQISLDEGVTNETDIVALFAPDDRVRYLDHEKLWSFLVEGEFWKATAAQGGEFEIAKKHIEFMIECARENDLVTEQDIVDGCTIDELVQRLPKSELSKLLKGALDSGRGDKPFKDELFLEITPAATLVENVPLSHLWSSVIVPKIAEPQRYVAASEMHESAAPVDDPDSEEVLNVDDLEPGMVVDSDEDPTPPPPISSSPERSPGSETGARPRLPSSASLPQRPVPKPPTGRGGMSRSKRLGSIDLNELGDEDDIDGELAKLFEDDEEPTSRTDLTKVSK